MATGGTFTDRTPPPFDKYKDDYSKWKKKLTLWQSITDTEKKKQGGLITLRLDDETQELVLESIDAGELAGEEGAKKVTDYLDKLFQKDKSTTEFEIYEEFEAYKRPYNLTMGEYINEFERRWKKTNSKGTALSQNVLAYRLLKSANLTDKDEQLLKATVKEMTYDGVKDQLRKIFSGRVTEEGNVNIKTEIPDIAHVDTFFGQNKIVIGNRYQDIDNAPEEEKQLSELLSKLYFKCNSEIRLFNGSGGFVNLEKFVSMSGQRRYKTGQMKIRLRAYKNGEPTAETKANLSRRILKYLEKL